MWDSSFFNHLPKEGGGCFTLIVLRPRLCSMLFPHKIVDSFVFCVCGMVWSIRNMFALQLLCWCLCYMVVSLPIGTKIWL